MVICIIALVVLGFLGIFSAKYRKWAKESARCVFRMATLRPCDTGFDEKVRAVITTALMSRHQGLARFTHRRFKLLSWIFMIAFVLSLGYSVYTAYNLAVFGTCDPVNPGDCVFNQLNPNQVTCPFESLNPAASVATIGGFMDIQSANITGKPNVYFFGTTWCPHCAWERPVFMDVTAKFAGYIDVTKIEIDLSQPPTEMAIFKHYDPDGSIPVIIIGGKYYRIGSGESYGVAAETNALTAILCKATGDPISECRGSDVAALENQIL